MVERFPERNALMRKDRKSGMSYKALGEKYKLTPEGVRYQLLPPKAKDLRHKKARARLERLSKEDPTFKERRKEYHRPYAEDIKLLRKEDKTKKEFDNFTNWIDTLKDKEGIDGIDRVNMWQAWATRAGLEI